MILLCILFAIQRLASKFSGARYFALSQHSAATTDILSNTSLRVRDIYFASVSFSLPCFSKGKRFTRTLSKSIHFTLFHGGFPFLALFVVFHLFVGCKNSLLTFAISSLIFNVVSLSLLLSL